MTGSEKLSKLAAELKAQGVRELTPDEIKKLGDYEREHPGLVVADMTPDAWEKLLRD